MEIIQEWLDGDCDYAFGVAIYSDLPRHNRNLLKTFQRKENTTNKEKLKYELKKYLTIPAVQFVRINKPKLINNNALNVEQSIIASENKKALFFHQLPPELQPVLLEAHQLFKENCFLKVQLNDLPQHAEKKALELQITIRRNFEQNALCWKKIDYFLAHRVIAPDVVSVYEGMTPAALLRKQQLLYASISKLNSRLKENNDKLKTAVYVADKSKAERLITKQEANLLKQNQELLIISKLIDG
jgi:hypothetical protein